MLIVSEAAMPCVFFLRSSWCRRGGRAYSSDPGSARFPLNVLLIIISLYQIRKGCCKSCIGTAFGDLGCNLEQFVCFIAFEGIIELDMVEPVAHDGSEVSKCIFLQLDVVYLFIF